MTQRHAPVLPRTLFSMEGFLYAQATLEDSETPITFTARLLVRVDEDDNWVLTAYDPDDPLRNFIIDGEGERGSRSIRAVWGGMAQRLAPVASILILCLDLVVGF